MLKVLVILFVLVQLISCQRGNPFKVFKNGAQRPKCSDNSRPTCVCPDGTVIDKYQSDILDLDQIDVYRLRWKKPCGNNDWPTCTCANGSSPQKVNTCNDGRRPTCAGGVNPVCPVSNSLKESLVYLVLTLFQDGSAYNAQAFPPCKGGRPRCADRGGVSCQDGTPLPANLARFG